MSIVNIEPVIIQQSPIIETSISIYITSLQLNISAEIDVQFMNSDGIVIEVKHLSLQQPDYSYWGSDDNFIINWTLQQLNLTLKQ